MSLAKVYRGGASDSYLELIREFPLRPLRNGNDYASAAAMIDRLALLDDKLSLGQLDYLETLELLIEAYDDQHASIRPRGKTPLDRLKYLMHQNNMNSAALGDLIGSRPMASMILNRSRDMSKAHIRKLADRFKVDAGYFI